MSSCNYKVGSRSTLVWPYLGAVQLARQYTPTTYKNGGFDLLWPSSPDELELFSFQVDSEIRMLDRI